MERKGRTELGVVGQTAQDRWNDSTQMRSESMAERGGQVDKERNESLPDVRTRARCVGDDLGKKTLHSVHSETGKNLRQTLSSSLNK
jgi:hypothetical protein